MIRKATLKDLDQIVMLENAIFKDNWTKQSFQAAMDMEDTLFLVAAEGMTVVGYALLYAAADEADITKVAVAPMQRRKGYGANLVMQLVVQGKTRGVHHYYLEVRDSNEPARAMYKRIGFEEVGTRKNYYDEPKEDAVIMKFEVGVKEC
ncbi:ribosomal protein S18-alanine N-acetyltransferase [Eubacterium oxidoreducens]|uniref:[Ribosomal protein bS18]-alanine N-acetyltransferase n=1 Tax=Eubacterium oxidoreducens TaxID=1732 RepID=A0A1G6CUJ5_EUBOX|nr:ribosomal protein S18-alanine N-acetyltransferase [Eubacterium oxidoreducens]SDB36553.1 ribosomal-protein-alanine N-acetyltransferase [Eubacterium oxidoreducens]